MNTIALYRLHSYCANSCCIDMYVFRFRVGYNYRLIQNPKIQTNLSINQKV